MDHCLISAGRHCQGHLYRIPSDRILRIGRAAFNDIVFEDYSISRRHCSIWQVDDVVHIEDNGSRNGTWVNYRELQGGVIEELCNGDRIGMGGETLRVRSYELPWRALHNDLVRRVAQSIDQEQDWLALPILGDALEDAGCADQFILDHCRHFHNHGRGCWVIELILDSTKADSFDSLSSVS